jgi:hypothetical protein
MPSLILKSKTISMSLSDIFQRLRDVITSPGSICRRHQLPKPSKSGEATNQSPRTPAAAIASDSNRLYEHAIDGKMYFTPEGYELPEKASLCAAFRM